jgi:tRNA uridine 5-carboxymethylaminomethyl modification enzyme
LTEKGRELGLVDDYRWRRFCEKMEAVEKETQRLQSTFIQASSLQAKALESYIEKPLTREARLMDLLKRPELDYLKLMSVEGIGPGVADEQVAFQVEVQAKYAGYISRQQEEIERNLRYENAPIPQDLDYREVKGLSAEVCQKLSESRPQTIGQASRISGVTPAAISLILVYLKKRNLLRKSA